MNKAQDYNGKPLHFSLNPEEQENEMFKAIPNEPKYEVSNLGRVRSLKKSGYKIISPYASADGENFKAKLSNQKYHRIINLVYLVFFGEIGASYIVKSINGNPYDLTMGNLEKVKKASLVKVKKNSNKGSTRDAAKVKPYHFTKDLNDLPNEKWKNIKNPELRGCYKISTLGRVKRLRHRHEGKTFQGMILTPFRNLREPNSKFRLIIRGKSVYLQDLVFSAFKRLQAGNVAECKDGDRRNVSLENLKQVKSTWTRIDSHLAQQEKKMQYQHPLLVEINIHDGDKETKLQQIKEMRKSNYCLVKENDGIYSFRLMPKEGDTVKVMIEGSEIAVNCFTVKTKDGAKYYLKGEDPYIFFLADELEIIKQS